MSRNDPTANLPAIDVRLRVEVAGRCWVLERAQPPLRLGRGAENDIVVGDDFTSRHHATVVYHDGEFRVRDDSRNGTFVVFDDGVTCRVHRGTRALDRHGTLRLGQPTSIAIAFALETRAAGDGEWRSSARRDANVIRRDGDYWTVRYDGRELRLKSSRGLEYLAILLVHAGCDFHALDLATPPTCGGGPTKRSGGSGRDLDARARTEYRRRLVDLGELLAEAEAFHDLGRTERLRAERDVVAHELARAVGLGGRDRAAGSDAERARVAVTQRIRHAIDEIRRHDAALGDHLASAVRTGRFCSYRPDRTTPVTWRE